MQDSCDSGGVTWIIFTAAILATYRLSLMVSKESGPMRMFRKLRGMPDKKSSLKEGLSCPLCTSVWFAAPIAGYLLYLGLFPAPEWPLWWLSLSGGAVLLHLRDGF